MLSVEYAVYMRAHRILLPLFACFSLVLNWTFFFFSSSQFRIFCAVSYTEYIHRWSESASSWHRRSSMRLCTKYSTFFFVIFVVSFYFFFAYRRISVSMYCEFMWLRCIYNGMRTMRTTLSLITSLQHMNGKYYAPHRHFEFGLFGFVSRRLRQQYVNLIRIRCFELINKLSIISADCIIESDSFCSSVATYKNVLQEHFI